MISIYLILEYIDQTSHIHRICCSRGLSKLNVNIHTALSYLQENNLINNTYKLGRYQLTGLYQNEIEKTIRCTMSTAHCINCFYLDGFDLLSHLGRYLLQFCQKSPESKRDQKWKLMLSGGFIIMLLIGLRFEVLLRCTAFLMIPEFTS